jgi:membrane protein implicated in regulation of membrane protease activity
MSVWIIWMLVGIGLLIAEVLVPGAFLMWIGLAACGTGLVTLAIEPRFELQVVAFAVLAAISLAAGLRLRRRQKQLEHDRQVNTRQAGLAGRSATVLAFHGREGRVRVGDSDWSARLPPGVPEPTPGATLRVVDVDGTVLIVRP